MKIRCPQYIFGIVFLSLIIFGSCSKMENSENYVKEPFLTLGSQDDIDDSEYSDSLIIISGDYTLNVNTPFGIFVSASSSLLTEEKLKELIISTTYNGETKDSVISIDAKQYSMLHLFKIEKTGIRDLSFTIVDNIGNSANKTIQLIVNK